MFDLSAFLSALDQLVQPINLLLLLGGVTFGTIIGILPGLGAPVAITVSLPFTFYMTPIQAFSLLLGIYSSAIYGGSVSAVTLGIPGTAAAAATLADGFQLFKRGRGGEALGYALIASVIGGIFSTICLAFIAPVVASFAIKFGPREYFSIGVFGIVVVGRVAGENIWKGLIMACIGVFLSCWGIDPVNGSERYIFGIAYLYSGIPLVPFLLGLYAVSEILFNCELKFSRPVKAEGLIAKIPGVKTLNRFKAVLLRSSIIGTIIGIIPGEGATIAAFMAYGEAKRASKMPEEFGQGSVEGIMAPEAANNSTVGGALIPTLTLGVPGSAVTAILMGALAMHGLSPGPKLFQEAPDLMYSIFIGLFIINFLMLGVGIGAIRCAARIIKIPLNIINPVVLLVSLVGAYCANSSLFSVLIMVWSGLFGYLMRKLSFPLVPCVLGFVLGHMVEVSFRQSLSYTKGNWITFVQSPIAVSVYFLLFLFLVGGPLFAKLRVKLFKRIDQE
jgi:putative tricarboxylic transport membrane protein